MSVRQQPSAADHSLVRWEFERNHQLVMCAIQATPVSYEVVTAPLWDVARTAVEPFASAAAALHRHAAIAADLRAAGWTVAAYTA